MSQNHHRVSYLSILIALSCCFVSETSVIAQKTPLSIHSSPQQVAWWFNLPRRGAPGNRRSAGKRDCIPETQNEKDILTAIIPKTNLGLTIAERPTFWVYVPYAPNSSLSLEFSLKDGDKAIYSETFSLTNTPGIVSIHLPDTVSNLEVDKSYTWHFKVKGNCEGQPYREVYGRVVRVALSSELKDKVEKVNPNERLKLYAENGLWFDTLTTLIELRRTKPKDQQLKTDWSDLLKQVNLEELISKPIVSCCNVP